MDHMLSDANYLINININYIYTYIYLRGRETDTNRMLSSAGSPLKFLQGQGLAGPTPGDRNSMWFSHVNERNPNP